jgi:methyl-accepting chemotaxis protein
MSFFPNLKIRTKILICFAVVIILGIIQGVMCVSALKDTAVQVDTLTDHADNVIIPINNLKAEFRSMRIYGMRLSSCEQADLQEYNGKIDNVAKNVKEHVKNLRGNASDDLLNKVETNLGHYLSSYDHIRNICADTAKTKEAKQTEILRYTKDDMLKIGNDVDSAVEQMIKNQDKISQNIRKTVEDKAGSGPIIFFTILNITLAIIFTTILSKSISARTTKLAEAANKVADGDLSVVVKADSTDEIGVLASSISTMVEHLRGIISDMSSHSETISSSAEELQYANKSISDSTAQILNQTLTVSAASEEMAATSKEIANNCNSAAMASEQTKETTLNSIETVRSTVSKIREHSKKTEEDASIIAKLGDETKQIDAIIATIQDIANQTNLLALNAAIEAARAGEHGRGFAVVSDEVRALANRTAQSTQEINKMIKAVQDEVSFASTSIGETVSQMEEIASETEQLEHWLDTIINQVNDVNNQINQIAVATEQQTATSNDMSQNLQKMADLTKEVSTNASDTVESASSMAKLSNEMADSAAKFTI